MSYSLGETLAGKNLVVVGGTGFLGKVWLALILTRFPQIGHIYLVVRPKEGQGVYERFVDKILGSEVFAPLREQHGLNWDAFVAAKVTPMAGDVSLPLCGIEGVLRDRMRGQIAAVVNVAGIVDFDPPLDEALKVNAFGCKNLVSLARDLGDARILHTSTCFTAGSRTGPVPEVDPRDFPFPRAGELDPREWSPDREIAECLDVIEHAKHRASDAFQQSAFLDQARQNLAKRDEPTRGGAIERELIRVRRKYVETQLRALGMERARFWGWPNTYTYTKSIGEQIVASSGLPFTIVRPAIVESTLEFPFPGWNEGINTSAPFIFLIREGGLQIPGSDNNLDLIPCDLVGAAILFAIGELIDGSQKPVYQAAASDTNPCTMARFFELSGLHKRGLYQRTSKGGPVLSRLQAHFESAFLSKQEYEAYGPHFLARSADRVAQALAGLAVGPWKNLGQRARVALSTFADDQRRLARIMDTFLPFVADYHYVFETKNTRAAFERLSEEEKALVPFRPETIDWRSWFLEIHAPTLEKRVFPLMEAKRARPRRIPERHETLATMLDDLAERHAHRTALGQVGPAGISRLSYAELLSLSRTTAKRLETLGVGVGDRVILAGRGGLSWPVAFFGVLSMGATVVPVDDDLAPEELVRIRGLSGARALIADAATIADLRLSLGSLPSLALERCLEPGPLAEILVRSGRGEAILSFPRNASAPKFAALLSHENITSALAGLSAESPITGEDRLLCVLKPHDPFQLLCGLLLPLSRGAQIVYAESGSAQGDLLAFRQARPTILVLDASAGRKLEQRVRESASFNAIGRVMMAPTLDASRALRRRTGIDWGRVLLPSYHEALGSELRAIVSVSELASRLDERFFQALGLPIWDCCWVNEISTVLSMRQRRASGATQVLGAAVPGIELQIQATSEDGTGDVWVRGLNIPHEYLGERDAVLPKMQGGWLHTAHSSSLDRKGRFVVSSASQSAEGDAQRTRLETASAKTPRRSLDGSSEDSTKASGSAH